MTKSIPLIPIASLAFEMVKHSGAWSVFVHKKGGKNHEFAYGGTARKRSLAIQKALSEFVERHAMKNSAAMHAILHPESTGYAARPIKSRLMFWTRYLVRRSALLEAKEKYVLQKWWHVQEIKYDCKIYQKEDFDRLLPCLRQLDISREFCKVLTVEVRAGLWDVAIIMIGMLKLKGFVVGCAAGSKISMNTVVFRAAVEVMRNLSIARRLNNYDDCRSSYLKKLYFQRIGHMDGLLKQRLARRGHLTVNLPKLSIDEEVQHYFDHSYYVYRCLYEGQPLVLEDYESIVL